jgi:carbamate kinase
VRRRRVAAPTHAAARHCLELDNVVGQATVAVITRVLVDADDPAFAEPATFIGPTYDERRVVGSPEPKAIVQLGAIRALVDGTAGTQVTPGDGA